MPTRQRARRSGDPLLEAMLADIARSGLDVDDARAMCLEPGDPNELAEMGLPAKMSYAIPYLDAKGKPTGFKRWRYLEDTRDGVARHTDAKPIRYVQTPDSMPEVYLPPQIDWEATMADPAVPIVVTEGEKKAAALCKAGIACLALGGVYSFKSKKRRVPMIRGLKGFAWADRDIVVAYDSDTHTNHMVLAARAELCRELTAHGAIPRVAEVTAGEDGHKRGVDDLLVEEGSEAVQALLDAAESFAAAEALHVLNTEVAYVRNPGIVVRLEDGQKMRPTDFTGHAYSNRHYYEITVDAKGNERMTKKKAAQAWLDWEKRFELAKMTYAPGRPQVTDDSYNTWQGWGCEPKKGNIAPWRALLDRLFAGAPEERRWFERWLALPLQRPGSKMFTCALLWGVEEGTGKSLVGKTLGRIYGGNYTLITDKELQDARNEWAQNKQFVLGDDVTGHENRKYAERLKVVITQEFMRIDPKFIPSFSVPDLINYLFTSNRPDAFFLDDNNRRNFVWEVTCAPMTKAEVAEYFKWLDDEGGAAHLFEHLLRLDLGDMEAADRAPWTAAKDAMIDDGQSALGRWARELKQDPDRVLVAGEAAMSGDLWSSQDLLRLYDPEERRGVTASAISRELKRHGIRLAYKGMPVPTPAGQKRLFVVRHADKWLGAKASELGKHYGETRVSAKRKKF